MFSHLHSKRYVTRQKKITNLNKTGQRVFKKILTTYLCDSASETETPKN